MVWDLPGLGRSKGPISLENFADNLAEVIEWSGNEKVLLVGHSIGGMTIQTLARDHPALFRNRVAGAVLLNTTYTDPLRTMIMPRFMQAIRWPILEPIMRLKVIVLSARLAGGMAELFQRYVPLGQQGGIWEICYPQPT